VTPPLLLSILVLPEQLFLSPQINATCKNLALDAGSLINHKPGRTLAPISPPPTFLYHTTPKLMFAPDIFHTKVHHTTGKRPSPIAGLQAMFVDIS
jgi:hypothetical protein